MHQRFLKIFTFCLLALCCSAEALFADFDSADSPQFYLNLLNQRGVPSFDSSDSPTFSLNLLGIRRAWADSDTFYFDWFLGASPQQGAYRLPAQPSDDKLLEFDNGVWITPTTPPPYGATVIILNHGWNGGPLDYVDFAQKIADLVPDAYIYIWHWGDGENVQSQSNPNGLTTLSDFGLLLGCVSLSSAKCVVGSVSFVEEIESSLSNAKTNGWLLGEKLLKFGIRPDSPYNHKIHMIGHSFGGVVCANAASKLYDAETNTKIKQLTTTETPALIWPYAIDNIDPKTAERVEVLYYDWTSNLLLGATGGPLLTTSDNVLNVELNPIYYLSNPLPLHTRAKDWYIYTIEENILNCENDPFGFGWSMSLDPSNPQWSQNFPLGYEKETELGRGCLSYIEGIKSIATKAADKVKDTFDSAATWVGEKAALVWDAGNGSAVSLTTASIQEQGLVSAMGLSEYQKLGFSTLDDEPDSNVAYIYKDINVPPDAEHVFFDYRFISYNPGDTLSLSIDNNTPLVIDAEVEGLSQSYKASSPVYIGDYAGQTITLQISLRSTGATPAQIYIDNLRFTAVTLTEDIDGDKAVDYADLSILAENWLIVGCDFRENCDGADIDRSNKVDFTDFARLATYWLESF